MWLIADFFKRYTDTVSRTFVRIMAAEAETNRKILAASRERRAQSALAARSKAAVQSVKEDAPANVAVAKAEPVALEQSPPTTQLQAAPAAHVPAVKAAEPVAAPEEPVAAVPAGAPEMPMGVRGDVVVGWLDRLSSCEKAGVADLLETLRKDKKVRVAELRMICSVALGEPPQNRKKAEYLAVLKSHFGPSERTRPTDEGGNGVHAA